MSAKSHTTYYGIRTRLQQRLTSQERSGGTRVIIGIEGTGSQVWEQVDLRRSFVRKVLWQSKERSKYYLIGPNNQGSDGKAIVDAAWKQLEKLPKSERLTLVGYSRGAAYCMLLAEMLARHRMVERLVLFDAVARNNYNQGAASGTAANVFGLQAMDIPDKIPVTVQICIHAIRDPAAGSRAPFGNVGLEAQSARRTALFLDKFFCSHGAMGGTSYDAVNEEGLPPNDVAKGLKNDTNTLLNEVGFPADPRYAKGPKYPVTNKAQDDAGMHKVGRWMWGHLINFDVLPKGAKHEDNAPAFSGSQRAGVVNAVQ